MRPWCDPKLIQSLSFNRAALDSGARTLPFSRSLRWTSQLTTATTGGPTNIHPSRLHPYTIGKRKLETKVVRGVLYHSFRQKKSKLLPPPAAIPSHPVSRPSTPAVLAAVRGGAAPRERRRPNDAWGGREGQEAEKGMGVGKLMVKCWILGICMCPQLPPSSFFFFFFHLYVT